MPNFFFSAGDMELTEYVRVGPGEGLGPYDPDAIEPEFSRSPLRDGGVLANTKADLAEREYPLFLNDSSPSALRVLEQQLNRELGRAPGILAQWRPPGSSQTTYLDIEAGRFEPDYSLRRDERGWMAGVLRLWTGPYGHTATERVIATGAGSGVLLQVAVPTIIQGDAPGLLDVRVTAGNTVPSQGRRVAFSVLPHPSYSADFPAASIGDRQTGATLVGLSGAHGSQYLGLPVSPTGASGIAAMVPLPIPSVYAGRNRVFMLAKSRLNSGVNVRMFDPFGNALGPTAVATALENWGLLDMGVLNIPDGQVPTTYKLPIQAGGASGNTVVASPGLHLNAVFLLPEDSTVLVNDTGAVAPTLAGDDFAADGNLTGQADDHGNTWRLARSQASVSLTNENGGAQPPATASHAGNYIDRDVQNCDTIGQFTLAAAPASGGKMVVRRDVNASYYIDAAYQHTPSKNLSLISVAAGATTLHASQALASLALPDNHYLTLRTVGGQAHVTLRRADGATLFLAGPTGVTVASIGASHANLSQYGNPGLRVNDTEADRSRFLDFAITSIPSGNLAARDVYRFNAPGGQITRNPSGLDITAYLEGKARGAIPKAPAPTAPRVVALVAPVDEGVGNDLLSVEVRARERFTFAR